MKKQFVNGLTSLLLPLSAYAGISQHGAYQRNNLRNDAVRSKPLNERPTIAQPTKVNPPAQVSSDELTLTAGQTARELVIVDAAVKDRQALYAGIRPGIEVVEINSEEDGLEQLKTVLTRYRNLSAVHLFSHAEEGELLLGNGRVSAQSLQREIQFFSALNGAIKEGGDLLLYGCNLAAGESGEQFLQLLRENSHVDIAASNDGTGNPQLGGDWELEVVSGNLDTNNPFSDIALKDFSEVLALTDGTGVTLDFDAVVSGYQNTLYTYTDVKGSGHNLVFKTDRATGKELYTYGTTGNETLYVGLSAGGGTGISSLQIYFSNGETFTLGSLSIFHQISASETFTIVGSTANSETSSAIASGGFATFNLSNQTNVTSVTLTVTGGADLDFITLDNLFISNVASAASAPTITDATYDASTGSLVVTATDLQSNASADIDASTFTLTGEGGATYTLTDTADVEISSATSFTLTLSATDKAAVNQILNKNGTDSTSGTTFNLAAADDWNTAVTTGDTSDSTGNGITASNVAVPTIATATYTANSGTLSVTGTGLLKFVGASNDIDASAFTFKGEAAGTYTLTDTSDVEINSGTGFSLTLSATDKAALVNIINLNGGASADATTYNLAVIEDWNRGADATVNIANASGIGITATNVFHAPTLTLDNSTLAYTNGDAATQIDAAAVVNDVDGDTDWNAGSLVVQITGNAEANDELSIDDTDGDGTAITISTTTLSANATAIASLSASGGLVTNGTALTISFNSSATNATVQEVLQSLRYRSTSSSPGTSDRTITVTATDTTALSSVDTRTVSVAVAPTLANINGDTSAWAGVGNSVSLDSGGDLTISATDFDALNGGSGNYAGISISLQRSTGAISSDVLGFNTSGALFSVSGSNLQSGGQTFATFSNSGGLLTITVDSAQTPATTALITNVLQRLQYRNDTPAGDATLRYTVTNGGASQSADVTVTSDSIYVTNTTDTASIDPSDGVSVSEAVAIAAADGSGSQTIVFDASLAGQTVSATSLTSTTESLIFDFDAAAGMTLNGGTLSLGGGTTLSLNNGSGDTASLATIFGGTGALTKTGAGTLTLSGSNSYSGTTSVSGGSLSVAGDGNLGSGAVTLNGGTLIVSGATTIDNAITLGAAHGTINNSASVTLSGVLSGTGDFSKTGAGTLTLSASNTFSGSTSLSAGSLVVTDVLNGTSAVTVASGTTLAGTGSIFATSSSNTLTVQSGGTLAPGLAGPGALTVNGNLTLAAGAILEVDITSAVSATGYDVISVNGAVDVGAASLTATHSYTAANGDKYRIIINDGSDAITGTFTGLSETATFSAAGNSTVLTTYYGATDALGTTGGNEFMLAAPFNSPPTLSNVDGDTLAWAGIGNTLTLDDGADASIADGDLDALNTGNGDYSGGSLSVQRSTGAAPSDTFGFATSGALFSVSGSDLQSGGQTFATFTNTGGLLSITFTSSGTSATTALVNDVAQRIIYGNDTPAGDALLRFTLSDGTSSVNADVSVTSDSIYITNSSDTAAIDVSDGVSFSEAIALAAADGSGSQTLILASALAGQVVSTSAATSLGESLTLDSDSAGTATLSGGSLSIGSGFTLTFSNGSADALIFASVLAGAGNISQTGSGSLTLSGNNSFTGTAATSSDLIVTHANGLGDSAGATAVNGGTLTISGAITVAENLSLDGSDVQLLNASGDNVLTGSIALSPTSGNPTLAAATGTRLTLSGVLTGASARNVFIGSTGNLGTVVLSGANTFEDYIEVLFGTLELAHGSALGGTTNGLFNLAAGATVALTGGITIADDIANLNGTGLSDLGAIRSLSGNNVWSGGIQLSTNATIAVDAGDLTLNGVISESSSRNLSKIGAGTLTLTATQTYTGLTQITAGDISIATDANLGTGAINLDGGTLTVSGSGVTIDNSITLGAGDGTIANANSVALSGVISGSAGSDLSKTGAGTLTLSATNTYAGATAVNAGTLAIAGDANLGTDAITLNNATLSLTAATDLDNAIVVAGTSAISAGASSTTLSGVISGSGDLVFTGGNTLLLSASNTYTGATTVAAATTVGLVNNSALGTSGAGTAVADTGTLSLIAGLTLAEPLTLSGAGNSGLGALHLDSGSASISANITLAADASIGVNGSQLSLSGAIGDGSSGYGLTKILSGVLSLSGNSTYTGATAVSVGTLEVSGSLASAVSVASGATLQGTGSLGGLVTINSGGILQIGGSPGTMTLGNGLNVATGATLVAKLNGTTAGTEYDQYSVTGSVTLGGDLSTSGSHSFAGGDTFTLINNDGADAVTNTFNGLAEADGVTINSSTLALSYVGASGNDVTLRFVSPTVSDANISIAGASGSGGIYKIGDTLTATWDNTSGGDNNSDISGVTVDFSAFGGGAAVAASNSAGIWTATFTLVASALDSSNLNISVTATNIYSVSTTGNDTSNASVDLIAPTVTDGNQSISGASGTGGVYKIGDTVTTTWDNSAGGDNNSDTISAVSVNFSAFGGGTAVAASNSGDIWSATYLISAGAIDSNNLNVEVTASDNAGNTTTTSDSANASVDSIAPIVTDNRITLSGASGLSGAFKAGDTITVTWDDTVGGDNNGDSISAVSVDFSAFGGGSAVTASNSSGTWTATLSLSAGALDGSNLNVAVTATDNAGNTTTTTDSSNATVDNGLPSVTDANLSIAGASGVGGAYIIGDTVTATWNNTSAGDNNGDSLNSVTVDFSQFGGGTAVVASDSGGTWTASYTLGAGAVDNTNRNVTFTVTDNAGNTSVSADSTNATVDNIAPTLTAARITPTGATGTGGVYKIGDTLTVTWDNTLSGDNNSDTIDSVSVNFSTLGGGSAVLASNSAGIWTASYTLAAGAIDSGNLNVILTATDNAGNPTTTADTSNVSGDNIAPIVTDSAISLTGGSGVGGSFINGDTLTTSWNNSIGGDNNSDTMASVTVDFSAFGGGAAVSASNSGDIWTATFAIGAGSTEASNLNVAITVTDNAGNTTTTADSSGVTLDNQAPSVTNVTSTTIDGNYKVGDVVALQVVFSEEITVSGTPQLTLETGTTDRVVNYTSGSGTTTLTFNYTVQVGDSSGDLDYLATTALALNGGTLSDAQGNAASLSLASPSTSNSLGANKALVIDGIAPTLTSSVPADNATDSLFNTNLVLTFSETVVSGSNSLNLYDAADNSLVETLDINASNVQFSGATVTVDWSANLVPDHSYYVQVDSAAIMDTAGNAYSGISDTTTLNFSVTNAAPIANNDAATVLEDQVVTIAVLANDTDADSNLNAASVNVTAAALNGTTSVNTGNGIITYTPAANYNGSDTFTYTVQDVFGGLSNTATVTISVTAVNDAPVALADLASTMEDNAVSIDVASNDTDIDSGDSVDPATLVVVSQPSHGSVVVTAGEMVFTPTLNYNGSDSFTYTIDDLNGATSNIATVIVNITGANDLPTAVDDSGSVDEDGSVAIDVVANDSDVDGTVDATTVQVLNSAGHGSTEVDALTGAITYTPVTNFNGSDSFTYVVQDNSGGSSNSATVMITVNSINDAPTANADTAVVQEDTIHNINVLGNDSDVDGTLVATSVTIVSAPSQGQVTVLSNGSIDYDPDSNSNGEDSFSYRVQDNQGAWSTIATVTITVNAVNDVPLANNDSASTDEDTDVTVDLLGNDSDIDGSLASNSVAIVTAVSHGNLLNNGDGSVTYSPAANYFGSDSFTYQVQDNDGGTSNVATVSLTINPVNDAPTLSGTPAGDVAQGSLYSFVPTSADTESQPLTFSVDNQPGWLSLNSQTGALSGTPGNGDVGVYSNIVMHTSDGTNSVSLAAFSITVSNINDAPVISGTPAASVNQDGSYSFTPEASDVDVGDSLSYSISNLPSWASFDPATGTLSGIPGNAAVGTYNGIVVSVSDGTASTSLDTFAVTVINVNDAPVANGDQYSLNEGGSLVVSAANGVAANDMDIDGDNLTTTLVTPPRNAQNFSLGTDGGFNYNHNGSETRVDSFTYTLSDAEFTTAPVTVNLVVAAVNDAPQFASQPPSAVIQGENLSYSVKVTDPDSIATLSLQQAPAWLSWNGNTLSGKAPLDASDTVAVVLRASDGEYTVDQSFDLAVMARELPLVSIIPTWKTLPARVGESITLKLRLEQSFGNAISSGRLSVRLRGLDSSNATMTGCSRSGDVFTCATSLSQTAPVEFRLLTTPSTAGNLVAELRFNETGSSTVLASNITDVSVSSQPVSQSNAFFNLANATAIASIDLLADNDKELVAGTGLGDSVKLLDYNFADPTDVTVLGEIDNRGQTKQVLVGDVDNDSLADIVVINTSGAASAVYYDRGGNFEMEASSQVLPNAVGGILRDLNDDGLPELILSSGGFNIYLYENRGGVFSDVPYIFQSPTAVAHFAMRKRQPTDAPLAGSLVISSLDAVQIIRFGLTADDLNKPGSGSSDEVRQFAVSSGTSLALPGVTAIQLVDIDSDGNEDIVFSSAYQDASADYSGINVVQINGDDSLQTVNSFGDASAHKLEVTDFNGDGEADLLVGNDNGTYQFYLGDGSFANWQLKDTVIFEDSPLTLAEDFNNDGLSDVLVYRDDQEVVEIYTSTVEGKVGVGTDLTLSTTITASSINHYRVQYQADIDNVGEDLAEAVRLTLDLDETLSPVALPDNCLQDDLQIICDLGDMAVQTSSQIRFELEGNRTIGTLSLASRVHGAASDSDVTDNTANNSLEGLFQVTQARVRGGGRSGGALDYGLLLLLGGALCLRRRRSWLAALTLILFNSQSYSMEPSTAPAETAGTMDRPVSASTPEPSATQPPSPALRSPTSQRAWHNNFYGELNLGLASSDWSPFDFAVRLAAVSQDGQVEEFDDRRNAWGILGGYYINRWLAVEAGYRDWGHVGLTVNAVSADPEPLRDLLRNHYPVSGKGPYLGTLLSYRPNDSEELFIKAGLWSWQGDYTLTVNDQVETFKQSDTDLLLGAGLNLFVTPHIGIGFTLEHVKLKGQAQTSMTANLKYRM